MTSTCRARDGLGLTDWTLCSDPLSAVLAVEKMSRPQVVKKLWEYIRQHELQNPSNKKEIICDDALRAVFSVDKIDMFRMNKVLGQCVGCASATISSLTLFAGIFMKVNRRRVVDLYLLGIFGKNSLFYFAFGTAFVYTGSWFKNKNVPSSAVFIPKIHCKLNPSDTGIECLQRW